MSLSDSSAPDSYRLPLGVELVRHFWVERAERRDE